MQYERVGKHSASSVRITSPPKGRDLRKVGPINSTTSPHCTQCKEQCDQCCKCCSAICSECLSQEPQNDKQKADGKTNQTSVITNGDTFSCDCPKIIQGDGKKSTKEKVRSTCGCF